MSRRNTLILTGIVTLGAFFLLYRLGDLSLSVDEFVNVQIERGTWPEILADLRRGEDLHPPLSHAVMSAWFRLVGESEWSARLPWSLVSILSIVLVYRLGATLLDERAGLVAAALTATAPTFVLYSRFDKYYALTMALFLAAALAGTRLWRRPAFGPGAWYAAALAALLYTDYLAPASLVLGQGLLLVFLSRDRRRQWRRILAFLAAWGIAGLLYVPWIGMLASQARTLGGLREADLSAGLVGIALKVGYLGYSLLLGETLFPWRIPAIVGIIGGLAAGGLGIHALRRRASEIGGTGLGILMALLVPGVVASALLTTWVFSSVPFIAFANHVLFALPVTAIILAAGPTGGSYRAWSWAAIGLLLVGRSAALGNYFGGVEFHNPIYAVPMREIVTEVSAHLQPGDVIMADPDTGFAYYCASGRRPAPIFSTTAPEPALIYLETASPARAWLVSFGRDRTRDAVPPDVQRWLDQHYRVGEVRGYVEQDATYSALKERLFDRPNYRYKLLVVRYDRPT